MIIDENGNATIDQDIRRQLKPHINIALTLEELDMIPCIARREGLLGKVYLCDSAGYVLQLKGDMYRIVEKIATR